MPSMSFRMARWLSSISPLRLMATISRSGSRGRRLSPSRDRARPSATDRGPAVPAPWTGSATTIRSSHRILEMQRGQPRRAERPVLLLRMLQDQQRNPAFDRRDAVANAQRQRLVAARTVRYRLRRAGSASGSDWLDIRPLYALRHCASTTGRFGRSTWPPVRRDAFGAVHRPAGNSGSLTSRSQPPRDRFETSAMPDRISGTNRRGSECASQ